MASHPPVYALILAGGSGTRFWPLSRNARPKQLLDLFGNGTLIAQSVRRLEGLVPPERILVLTSEAQRDAVVAALPGVPPENVVAEPARRDTAPAIALAAAWIAARDPSAVMVALPADQLVEREGDFREVLAAAAVAAESESAIVTLGIRPDWPCPSYGYIERGEALPRDLGEGIVAHEVVRFREKPDVPTAEAYLASGRFSWNAGIFVWTLPTLRAELAAHCPQLAEFVSELSSASDFDAAMRASFPSLEKISIDFALMEKAERILNIEADIGWDDVGGWPSVAKYLDADEQGNATQARLVAVDSSDNIVFSEHGDATVALLGVSGLIVVHTADAILVADRSRADEIKRLVDMLPDELA